MGIFKPKKPKTPDPEQIRKEEQARIEARDKKAILESNKKRRAFRNRLAAASGGEEDEVGRKQLFGQ
jgi:hypothetical protein